MKIEKGKFYKDAKGNKVGPMKDSFGGGWHYEGSKGCFEATGISRYGFDPDLIEEWSDSPSTFGQLTDAEKGALLLADHEGKRIEYSIDGKDWYPIGTPVWRENHFYRIAPTRVTGTCEVGPDGKPNFDTWEEF